MRDSDQPRPAPLGRGYWEGLAGACAVIVAAIVAVASMNLAVDPIGTLGRHGAHVLNQTMPRAVLDHLRSGAPSALHRLAAERSGADVFLIGPSRVVLGFEVCSHPGVLKLAGSSWGAREVAAVSDMVLRDRTTPAVLLIEVGLPTDDGRPGPDTRAAMINAALSPRITLLSLQTIAASLSGDGPARGDMSCRAISHQTDWRKAAVVFGQLQRVTDVSPASLRRGRDIVRRLVGAADEKCRRTGVRHTLVLFALPPTPSHPAARAFTERVSKGLSGLRQDLAARPFAGGCRVVVADMTGDPPGPADQQGLWADRSAWLDYTHFSPRLGEFALEALINVARSDVP